MKTKCKFEKDFKPFKVEIEFESAKEAKYWVDMFSLDVSIPSMVNVADEDLEEVQDQMRKIRKAIQEGNDQ